MFARKSLINKECSFLACNVLDLFFFLEAKTNISFVANGGKQCYLVINNII